MRLLVSSNGTPDGDLLAAAARGDVAGMSSAIHMGADPNYYRESSGIFGRMTKSPIVHAVKNRRPAAVEFLLDQGVSTETCSGDCSLLLLCAGMPSDYTEAVAIARLLLRGGANITATDADGFSAIQRAVSTSSPGDETVEMVTLLAVHGASTAGLRAKLQETRAVFDESYSQEPTYDEMRGRREPGWRKLLDWADSVEGCPPFQIAIAHGLHGDATAALQLGYIDPADCLGRAEAIHKAAAKTGCLATISLAKLALAEWSPHNHHLYYLKPQTHAAIRTSLLVCNRLQAMESAGAAAVPVLQPELWKHIIRFLARRSTRT